MEMFFFFTFEKHPFHMFLALYERGIPDLAAQELPFSASPLPDFPMERTFHPRYDQLLIEYICYVQSIHILYVYHLIE